MRINKIMEEDFKSTASQDEEEKQLVYLDPRLLKKKKRNTGIEGKKRRKRKIKNRMARLSRKKNR